MILLFVAVTKSNKKDSFLRTSPRLDRPKRIFSLRQDARNKAYVIDKTFLFECVFEEKISRFVEKIENAWVGTSQYFISNVQVK